MYPNSRNYDSSYDYYRDMAEEMDRDEVLEVRIYEEMDRGKEESKWQSV